MGIFNFIIPDHNGNGNGDTNGPFVRRSKYEKLQIEKETAEQLAASHAAELRAERQRRRDLDALLTSYRVAVPELDRQKIHLGHQINNLHSDVADAEAQTQAARKEANRVLALHAGRTRVGCLPKIEPARVTARMRGIEPSIRVEEGEDEWIIYSDRILEEPEIRAIESEINVMVDRT